jgi:hypothetical protein
VRLSNGYKTKAIFTVVYETVDDADQVVESAVQIEVGPGEVVDLFEGKWRVNAQRIRFTAEADDGKQWRRFEKRWMPLVTKSDAKGVLGYASPTIETSVVAIK